MANLLSTNVSGRLYTSGHVDTNTVNAAFRFYDSSIFRGGLGLDDWAHSGSANDITLYVSTDSSFYVSTSGTKRVRISSGEARFITYSADTNYNIRVTGGDQFNAYYGENATTLYVNWNGGTTRFGGEVYSGSYLYTNGNIRVGEIWGYGGIYRSDGSMLFGVEGDAGWSFRSGNTEKLWIGNDGNIYMSWAGAYISTLLDAKQNASTAITTSNIGSQSVSYADYTDRAYHGIIQDTRSAQLTPNNYADYRVTWEFTNQITGISDWHSVMTMQGWHDGYAAWQIIGPSSTTAHENWYLRSGNTTSWNTLRTIIHSGNIGSQSVNYAASAGNSETTSQRNFEYISVSGNRFDITGAGGQISFKDSSNVWTGYVGFDGDLGVLSFPGRNVRITSGYNGTIELNTGTDGFNSGVISIPYGRLIVNNSYIEAGTAVYSPIYYDGNDNSYYLNPNSSSRIRNLYVGDSGSDWVDTGGWGTQFHLSNGPHSIIRVYARDEGIQTGMFSHVGGQSKVGSLTNHDFTIIRNYDPRMTFYSGYTYANGYVEAADSLRAPIFYDSNDTAYYVDPNGESSLSQLTTNTRARWNMPRYWTNRQQYTGDQGYWTGTNGWAKDHGNWANAWQGGFSGWDIWGEGTDHPQGAGYIHAQGIVSGQHYSTSNVGYGWMMVGAANATDNRYWLRGKWDTATSEWVEMITSGNIGSQSVNYASYSGAVYGNQGGSFGLNDTKLYLRTNGDENHYLWNADDDWEELNAYEGTGFRITSNRGDTGVLYVYGASNGGYTYSPYSFRAPIFYDSEDTTYYLDPNSNVSGIFAGSVGINNTSPINTAWGTATTTKQLSIDGTNYAVINLLGAGRRYSMGVGDEQFYMCYDNNAGRHNIIVGSDGSASFATDVRAPIFYDSNNTDYYGDFAGTSRMNEIVYDNLKWAGNQSYGLIGVNGYLDTLNGRGSDPLELNYYDGGPVKIGSGTYGSKDLYASMVYVSSGNAVIHAGNIGSQSVSNADTVDNIHGTSFVRNDTTGQYLKPYYEYGSYLTSERPIDLVSQMGGGGLRVDFMYPTYTGDGNWGHVITWSGYNGYTMYQLSASYGPGVGAQLYMRNEADHNRNSWSSWRRLLNNVTDSYAANMDQNVRTIDTVSFPEIRLNGSTARRLYGESVGSGYNCVRVQGNWETFDIMGRVLDWTGSNLHFGNGYNGVDHSSHYVIVGNPVSYFKVEGPIYATGDVIAYYSDRRLKQNIQPIDSAIDIINKIGAYTFEWNKKSEEVWSKKEGDKDFGLISQEVEAVWPMGVAVQGGKDINDKYGYGDPNSEHYDPLHIEKNPEEYKTVRYDKMVTLAIAAIKEQQAQIDQLKEIINGLTK